MKKPTKVLLASLFGLVLLASAGCDSTGSEFEGTRLAPADTNGTLQSASQEAGFPVGIGISADDFLNDGTYASIVRNQFDQITAEYAMKQGPIVQSDGSFDYSTADEVVNRAQEFEMDVYGHTLVWHSNNNGDYLRSLVSAGAGGGGGGDGAMLLANGGFESWSEGVPEGWSVLNSANGSFSQTTMSSNVHGGSSALQATVDEPSDSYNLQILSPEFPTTAGETYEVQLWLAASASEALHQVEWRGNSTSYTGDQSTPTSYAPVTYSFTADADAAAIALDLGASPPSDTYVDDIAVTEVSGDEGGGSGSATQDSLAVDSFMRDYITATVNHYAEDNLTGWDVVNEPIQDGTGTLRTDNSPDTPTEGDTFYWAKYLGAPEISDTEAMGESYIANAFRYAEEADPDVPLYINDYNLESDATKRGAMVQLVNALLENDVPVDGIGTQMHINLNTSYAGIDQTFRDLASTGLMVRVTELDVRINPEDNASFEPTPTLLSYQQVMYNYVVWSYMQNVPEDQRAGISVWNLTDSGSWIVRGQGNNDYPTLYNEAYQKKPAFSGFLRGLRGLEPASDE